MAKRDRTFLPRRIFIEPLPQLVEITRAKLICPCFDLSYLSLVADLSKHRLKMGIVKKASKLLEGVRRHQNESRSLPFVTDEGPVVSSKGRIGRFFEAQKLRRKATAEVTAEAARGDRRKATMAQRTSLTQETTTRQVQCFRKPRVMAEPQRIQIVEDEEEEEQEEEDDDDDEPIVDDESESEDEVDESVIEDMRKLEESFKGISQKYRLINRIGEGEGTSDHVTQHHV